MKVSKGIFNLHCQLLQSVVRYIDLYTIDNAKFFFIDDIKKSWGNNPLRCMHVQYHRRLALTWTSISGDEQKNVQAELSRLFGVVISIEIIADYVIYHIPSRMRHIPNNNGDHHFLKNLALKIYQNVRRYHMKSASNVLFSLLSGAGRNDCICQWYWHRRCIQLPP